MGAKMEPKSKKNRVRNHKIFCADPVSQKIEKMSAPERSADFWASTFRAKMAVGRGVGGKVNLPQDNKTLENGKWDVPAGDLTRPGPMARRILVVLESSFIIFDCVSIDLVRIHKILKTMV